MNTHRATTLCLFLAASLVLTGCFDKLNGAYDGEDKIAFSFDLVAQAEQNNEPAATTLPVPSSSDTSYVASFETELIGPQRSNSVNVNFSTVQDRRTYVREVPTDTGEAVTTSYILARKTTAEEGTHYEFPQNGSYTLPADSSTANVQVRILGGSLQAGETRRLAIKLDGNESQNLIPAERLRYFTINLRPAQ